MLFFTYTIGNTFYAERARSVIVIIFRDRVSIILYDIIMT